MSQASAMYFFREVLRGMLRKVLIVLFGSLVKDLVARAVALPAQDPLLGSDRAGLRALA